MRGNFTNHPANSGQFKKGRVAENKGRRTSLGLDDAERFWKFVDRTSPDGCWPWRGAIGPKGYGHFMAWRTHVAHRVAYRLTYGQFPQQLCVLHRCDNPPCCRPDHLFLGTKADNNADMRRKGRMAAGEKHGRAKLTSAQVRYLRILRKETNTPYRILAELVGLPEGTVYYAIRGINWKYVID